MPGRDGAAKGGNDTTTRQHKNASVEIDEHELAELTDRLDRVRPVVTDALGDLLAPKQAHHAQALTDALLKASTDATTLNEACHATPLPVSRRTLEKALTTVELAEVEQRVNEDLWSQAQPLLPSRIHVAVDVKQIEYWGNADAPAHEDGELTRSRPRNGTKHFHRYVTAYLCRGNKRYTLAVHFVPGDQTPHQALEAVLAPLLERGLEVDRLLLDRGFSDSKVAGWLMNRDLSFVMPWIQRGALAETIKKARGSHWLSYAFGPDDLDVQIALAVKRGTDGLDRLPYIAHGFDTNETTPHRVHKLYRQRPGVETSYREMNKARARTNSRDAARRLLFVGVAFVLSNAHITIGWETAPPKRGRTGREREPNACAFKRFLRKIVKRLDFHYGVVVWIPLPSGSGGG